eukprot:2979890-Prymnesium_polylepis.1
MSAPGGAAAPSAAAIDLNATAAINATAAVPPGATVLVGAPVPSAPATTTWRADRAGDVVVVALTAATAGNSSLAPPWWVLVALPQSVYVYGWMRLTENLVVMVLGLLLASCYLASVSATDTLEELLALSPPPPHVGGGRDADGTDRASQRRGSRDSTAARASIALERLRDGAKLPADHLELCVDALKPSVWSA